MFVYDRDEQFAPLILPSFDIYIYIVQCVHTVADLISLFCVYHSDSFVFTFNALAFLRIVDPFFCQYPRAEILIRLRLTKMLTEAVFERHMSKKSLDSTPDKRNF